MAKAADKPLLPPPSTSAPLLDSTRARPFGPGKGVVEARHTGARKCAEREECITWRARGRGRPGTGC